MSGQSVEAAAQVFVKMFVADLERSAAFYGASLGFVAGGRFSTPEFDELILRPGEVYATESRFRFTTEAALWRC